MEISEKKIEDVNILSLSGRLYALSADEFQKRGDELISACGHSIIINLHDLTYISSGGLRALVYLTKKLKKMGQELVISEIPPPIEDIIDMSGLNAIFNITENDDLALKICKEVR